MPEENAKREGQFNSGSALILLPLTKNPDIHTRPSTDSFFFIGLAMAPSRFRMTPEKQENVNKVQIQRGMEACRTL